MKFLKNAMKSLKKRGFTLAEMLIVMAVVVVLAAAALPKIGSTIEGAHESNDLAALSAAYTEAYTKVAMKLADGSADSGDLSVDVNVTFESSGTFDFITGQVGGVSLGTTSVTAGTHAVTFAFTGSTGLENLALASITVGT